MTTSTTFNSNISTIYKFACFAHVYQFMCLNVYSIKSSLIYICYYSNEFILKELGIPVTEHTHFVVNLRKQIL